VPVELVCEFCGSSYEVKPSRKESSRFCSKECQYSWSSENITGENHHSYSRKEVNCSNCDKKFKKTDSQIERSKKHFCSESCRKEFWSDYCENMDYSGREHHNWSGGSIKTECNNCGKAIEISQGRNENYDKSFCSQDCYGIWLSKNKKGENHPLYKENSEDQINYRGSWKKKAEKSRNRDGGCIYCGMKIKEHEEVYGFKPPVHHIKRYESFEDAEKANKLKNLVTLCCEHHRKIEEGIIELPNN